MRLHCQRTFLCLYLYLSPPPHCQHSSPGKVIKNLGEFHSEILWNKSPIISASYPFPSFITLCSPTHNFAIYSLLAYESTSSQILIILLSIEWGWRVNLGRVWHLQSPSSDSWVSTAITLLNLKEDRWMIVGLICWTKFVALHKIPRTK